MNKMLFFKLKNRLLGKKVVFWDPKKDFFGVFPENYVWKVIPPKTRLLDSGVGERVVDNFEANYQLFRLSRYRPLRYNRLKKEAKNSLIGELFGGVGFHHIHFETMQ